MKQLFGFILLIGVAALGAWGFTEGRREVEMEELRERPIATPLRIVRDNGIQELQLSAADETASGIRVETITAADIPSAAVVWSDGKAWIYVATNEARFRKVGVALKAFGNDRYMVEGLSLPARIVAQGAQILLSEEERGAIKIGEESE